MQGRGRGRGRRGDGNVIGKPMINNDAVSIPPGAFMDGMHPGLPDMMGMMMQAPMGQMGMMGPPRPPPPMAPPGPPGFEHSDRGPPSSIGNLMTPGMMGPGHMGLGGPPMPPIGHGMMGPMMPGLHHQGMPMGMPYNHHHQFPMMGPDHGMQPMMEMNHHRMDGGGGGRGGGGGGGGGRGDGGPIRGRYGAVIPPPLPGAGPGSNTKILSNDYSQHFVDSGQRPQNFLRDSHLTDRYEEYPKMKELINRKDELVSTCATPPYYLKADLRNLKLSVDTFGTKFDIILVDPPWEEYVRRAPGAMRDPEAWAWQEIMALEIENVADTPSFVFLWCGCAEGLEAGRHCLTKWGFRRSEDICWIKTNNEHGNRKYLSAVHQEPTSVLVHTKEHCLMGIKGSVRRAQDGHVIHANCDTDIIVSEEPPLGSTAKPEEMYQIIERFCNGRRRLELFGEDHNIRPGWVTVGRSLSTSNFNPGLYSSHFKNPDGSPFIENRNPSGKAMVGAPNLLPFVEQIEELRPKSPPGGGRR